MIQYYFLFNIDIWYLAIQYTTLQLAGQDLVLRPEKKVVCFKKIPTPTLSHSQLPIKVKHA